MNITFMFSGQGAQYVGMCQELYDENEVVRELFTKASEVLNYDIKEIMFNDENKLNDTLYTQPLMFVMYVSIVEVLRQNGIESTNTLGLSLGEYGALYDAGMIDFETGLRLLEKRGLFMNQASRSTSGKMSAILGMEADVLEAILEETEGYVKIANYNTYGQLVISGESDAVLQANDIALSQKAKRTILLNTSGPFHTSLMNEASELFSEYIADVLFKEPTKKLLVNTTGDYYSGDIKKELSDQITSSVMFYQMIEKLINEDTAFIEIGPKRTLCSFVKKISRKATILNVEDVSSLNKTLYALEEKNEL